MKISCPLGFVCPNPRIVGSTNLFESCPKGTYLKTLGGTSSAVCTNCDAGYGCVEPGGADKYKECGAGYYCFSGSPTTTPLIYCSTLNSGTGVTPPTYDSATNSVIFDGQYRPTAGSTVTIEYAELPVCSPV